MITIYTHDMILPKYLNDKSLMKLSLVNNHWSKVTYRMRQHRSNKKKDIKKLFYQFCAVSMYQFPNTDTIPFNEPKNLLDLVASGEITFKKLKTDYIHSVYNELEMYLNDMKEQILQLCQITGRQLFILNTSGVTTLSNLIDNIFSYGTDKTKMIIGLSIIFIYDDENKVELWWDKIVSPWLREYIKKYYI